MRGVLVIQRELFFLTVAYVIGFAIPVLFYVLISKGKLPSSKNFSAAFGI